MFEQSDFHDAARRAWLATLNPFITTAESLAAHQVMNWHAYRWASKDGRARTMLKAQRRENAKRRARGEVPPA